MKQLILFLIITYVIYIPTILSAYEGDDSDDWRLLSAHCQNLYSDIFKLERKAKERDLGAVDMARFEKDIKGVEFALNALVQRGLLVEKVVWSKPIEDVGDNAYDRVFGATVDRLSKIYGVFVASEMCGLGEHMRFGKIDRSKPLQIRVRLPANEMKRFLQLLNSHNIAIQASAEQDAAPNR